MNPYIPPMEIRSSRLRVARKRANPEPEPAGAGAFMSSLTSPSHSEERRSPAVRVIVDTLMWHMQERCDYLAIFSRGAVGRKAPSGVSPIMGTALRYGGPACGRRPTHLA